MRTAGHFAFASALSAALVAVPFVARATNVTEFPDNGSEQMARGGAWIARASDPLAAIFNPAGLAGQRTRVTIQSNIIFEHTCFTRIKAASDTTNDPLAGAGGAYPRVCNDISPTVNPQIGVTLRLSDRVGLGLLVIGPSSSSDKTFPEFVNDGNGQPQASPSRYLFVEQAGIILTPTVGVGYEILDNVRIGGSFSWGIARVKLAAASMSLNADRTSPSADIRGELQAHDYFVPGFTLGGLWSASPEIDVAGWYKWSDAIRARGDAGTAANYYTSQNAAGDTRNVRYGDTIYEDCGTGTAIKTCAGGENATLKVVVPMEAKLGVRYHKPRTVSVAPPPDANVQEDVLLQAAGPAPGRVRDPLATDVFDIEADLTWANNSAADTFEIRFPGDATGRGLVPVSGVTGGEVPPNSDQKRGYKDVIGIRVGGDYNVLPDRLALRGGAFFETSAADPALQNIDFAAAARLGLAAGGTYRIRLGEGENTNALELMLGFEHVFVVEQTRKDPNASGTPSLAGTSCNGSVPDANDTSKCADGNPRYRSKWPVNLGTIGSAINVINVGVAYRF